MITRNSASVYRSYIRKVLTACDKTCSCCCSWTGDMRTRPFSLCITFLEGVKCFILSKIRFVPQVLVENLIVVMLYSSVVSSPVVVCTLSPPPSLLSVLLCYTVKYILLDVVGEAFPKWAL